MDIDIHLGDEDEHLEDEDVQFVLFKQPPKRIVLLHLRDVYLHPKDEHLHLHLHPLEVAV